MTTSLHRAGLLVALAAAVTVTAGCSSSTAARPPSTPATTPAATSAATGPVDATARRVAASFKVGAKIGPLAVGDGWLWATNTNATVVGQGSNGTNPSLMRIDTSSKAVTATVDLASNPGAVLVAGGLVHVGLVGKLVDVDTATMRVTGQYDLPGEPSDMASTPGALWIGLGHDGTLVRFDLASHAVTATLRIATPSAAAQLGRGEPSSVVAAGGSVWASMDVEGKVARIDPSSATIAATDALPAGQGAEMDMAAAPDGSIWISSGGHLAHLDTRTGAAQVLGVDVPGAGPVIPRGNDLWVAGAANTLYHVDVAAARVVETVGFGSELVDIVDDGGMVWIASLANDLTRVDTH